MRPMRRGFRPVFPGLQGAAAWLAVALIVGSVVFALTHEGLGPLLLLVPGAVLRGYVWQPLSYGFVDDSPMGVIFGALILWQLGGALEKTWGTRRMSAFAVGTTVLAGVVTVLLALLVPALAFQRFAGGFVMGSALWVAYGLSFGRQQTNFWGLPVSGNVFALIGVGFVFLERSLLQLPAGHSGGRGAPADLGIPEGGRPLGLAAPLPEMEAPAAAPLAQQAPHPGQPGPEHAEGFRPFHPVRRSVSPRFR